LNSPNNGWSTERIINIRGETNVKIPWITVVYNRISFLVPLDESGNFSRKFIASSGMNTIYTEILQENKKLSDSITFYSLAPTIKLRIVLFWDTDKSYVDLWITEPGGELCKWDMKNTKSGGTLDIGNDYPGFGPQIYTHPDPPKGTYNIQVHYYADGGQIQSNAKVYVVMNEGGTNEILKTYDAMLTKAGNIINIENITFE
jgi:uncharacterized protein YfaP (DUF2135 family)